MMKEAEKSPSIIEKQGFQIMLFSLCHVVPWKHPFLSLYAVNSSPPQIEIWHTFM